MSSTTSTPKKGTAATTANVSGGAAGRRQPAPGTGTSASPTPGASARATSPSNVLSTNGVARNSSVKNTPGTGRPARPSVRKPAGSNTSLPSSSAGDIAKAEEAKAEHAALIDSLKKSLQDAEAASEDYQRQLATAQQRVDELMAEHAKLEEQYHESTEKIGELEFDKRESKRHTQEMERIYESERLAMMKDREDAAKREAELKGTVQRLKENAAGREVRTSIGASGENRSPRQGRSPSRGSPRVDEFAPSGLPRSDSQGTSRLVMQKDQIIEGLRLELAEAQIKLVENEHAGGDRTQDLERQLLETRMTNARLMEDNESFQLLLGERTISGDFQKTELMQNNTSTSGLGSLAEELETAEGESANYRRLEAELRSQKDQNKALTLYIEKIISRVLQHDNFETILDQKDGVGAPPGSSSSASDRNKELPPPPRPSSKDEQHPAQQQESFMQRATSVVRRQRPVSAMFASGATDDLSAPATAAQQPSGSALTARKPRPQSVYVPPAPPADRFPTANEDPTTAPSIPLGRSVSTRNPGASSSSGPSAPRAPPGGHRRNPSDKSNELASSTSPAAGLVNQMYRGPAPGTAAPGSPLMSPASASRLHYFSPMKPRAETPNSASMSPQQQHQQQQRPRSNSSTLAPAYAGSSPSRPARDSSESRLSTGSVDSVSGGGGAAIGVPGSSTPAGAASSSETQSPPRDRQGNTQYTGAVMQQNKLRPLRLVQESGGEDAAAQEAAAAAAAAKKKANRGSWMGWFNRGKEEGPLGLGLAATEEEQE